MKSNQSQAFRHAQVYVHGLYGCAGGPFAEVVEAGDEQHAFGIAINSQVDTVAAVIGFDIVETIDCGGVEVYRVTLMKASSA